MDAILDDSKRIPVSLQEKKPIARMFPGNKMPPLKGISMENQQLKSNPSHEFIKQGILFPLIKKSDDNVIGKKVYSKTNKDIFNLNYDYFEQRKVPFGKMYNREKLVLLNSNPSILTRKESLSNLKKNRQENELHKVESEGVSTFMQRLKNIHGKGKTYKLKRELNDQVDEKIKEVIAELKTDKKLSKTLMVNRKKMSHADVENLFQLNSEIHKVRGQEAWFTDYNYKKAQFEFFG